jgi:hypothetical protein
MAQDTMERRIVHGSYPAPGSAARNSITPLILVGAQKGALTVLRPKDRLPMATNTLGFSMKASPHIRTAASS